MSCRVCVCASLVHLFSFICHHHQPSSVPARTCAVFPLLILLLLLQHPRSLLSNKITKTSRIMDRTQVLSDMTPEQINTAAKRRVRRAFSPASDVAFQTAHTYISFLHLFATIASSNHSSFVAQAISRRALPSIPCRQDIDDHIHETVQSLRWRNPPQPTRCFRL
jgi:hypothetical protein